MTIARALLRFTMATAVVAATVSVVAGPAQAAPVEHDISYTNDSSLSTQDPNWPCQSLGFDVTITRSFHETFRLVTRGRDGQDYGTDTLNGYVSYSANGSTFKDVFSVVNKDFDITVNQDGSLSIIVLATGGERWFLNGVAMFHNPGQVRYELLITNPGTDQEQETFVGNIKGSTGLNNGPPPDFCANLAEFLAP